MLIDEELWLKMFWIAVGTFFFVMFILFPYIRQFLEDVDVFLEERNEKLSFMIYLKKESYRVLDILTIIYFLPLWLISGVVYVVYVVVQKLERLMYVTVFTKKGSKND
ncbi:hypothetical protein [Paenibacillus polymyxa]|uniref:hypothetical protein n=1 Tax=Paenibacillus polymyxa TaxID=1406 RepID=UPI000737C098|nr:hypothetical protein [Paenibacillus polymyxa]